MTLVVDLLLVVAFLLTVIVGARHGFFRELFSILGVIGGFVVAVRLGPAIQGQLPGTLQESSVVAAVLFLVIFVGVSVVMAILGALLAMAWEGKKPTGPSRILGAVLGGVRGLILALFLVGAIVLLAPPGSETLGRSRVLPRLGPGISLASRLLPSGLRDELLRRWDSLPFQGTEPHRDDASRQVYAGFNRADEGVSCHSGS